MGEKIKICCVIPSLSLGGMERVMSELVNYFADVRKANVTLVLYGKERDIKYHISENVVVYRPDFTFNDNFRTFYTIKTIIWLRKTIKEINPNSVLSFGEYWNNLVLISLLRCKIPIFVSDRSQPNKSLGIVQNSLRKYLYKNAKGVICQTKKSLEIYNTLYYNGNKTVISNPIREIKSKYIIKENIVISVGRLISSKNFDRLINIFSSIDSNDWKLMIVGGDSNKENNFEKLKQIIVNKNLEDKIELLGYRTDIDELLLKSKIFAFTSSSEGFPNVIGEAMSAGLPVVSYDCVAGPSDIIEEGKNGFLIPLFDDEKFEKKLRYLMENEDKRLIMGINARESIQKFSVENIGEKFYQFILENL